MCIHYSVAAAEDATVSKYAVCCPRELALHVHARFVGAERMTRTHESVSQTWIVDVFSNGRNASEWNPLAHGFVSPLNGPCVHNIHRRENVFPWNVERAASDVVLHVVRVDANVRRARRTKRPLRSMGNERRRGGDRTEKNQ